VPVPPLPYPGVPAELVARRPDIQAAFLRLRADDKRTAAAVADLFPKIRLSASMFFQERELANLFDKLLWSLAGLVSQPLFDGGRRFAEIDRAEAAAQEQLVVYGQTVLLALREVQDALVSEARQAEFVRSLEAQLESARQALELSRDRYRQGAVDFLRVLTALQTMQQIEQNLVEARRKQFSNRIQLCRALGGGIEAGELKMGNVGRKER
jgi:outer membrane protein TolC